MLQVGWKFVSFPNCWYGCVHAKVDDIDIDINIDGMVHLIKMRFFPPFWVSTSSNESCQPDYMDLHQHLLWMLMELVLSWKFSYQNETSIRVIPEGSHVKFTLFIFLQKNGCVLFRDYASGDLAQVSVV